MHPLVIQNAFLIELARLEKAQADEQLICTRIEFCAQEVLLELPHGSVTMPITADAFSLSQVLSQVLGRQLDAPNDEASRVYPESGTLASRWAELHYDLGLTDFLIYLDDSISFISLRLDGCAAIVVMAFSTVDIPVKINLNEYPVHAASDIGEAINRWDHSGGE